MRLIPVVAAAILVAGCYQPIDYGTRLSVIIEALLTDAQGGVYSSLWLAKSLP